MADKASYSRLRKDLQRKSLTHILHEIKSTTDLSYNGVHMRLRVEPVLYFNAEVLFQHDVGQLNVKVWEQRSQ